MYCPNTLTRAPAHRTRVLVRYSTRNPEPYSKVLTYPPKFWKKSRDLIFKKMGEAKRPDFLAFEDVAAIPRPATICPGSVAFSPSDDALFYLAAGAPGSTNRNLFSHAVGGEGSSERVQLVRPPALDTEETLSAEEKLRRERMRQMSTGVTSYTVAKTAVQPYVLVPMQGDLYVQDLGEGPGAATLRLVFDKTSTGASGGAIDAQLSPDGTRVAFVQDKEVYVARVSAHGEAPHKAIQVTSGARGCGKMNGLADFIAQEEMDRYRGFWWSPCGTRIAFEQVDEAPAPVKPAAAERKSDGRKVPPPG